MSHSADRLRARSKLLARPAALAARRRAIFMEWQRRARGRRELAKLNQRELRDLGYSTSDVMAENLKPFWTP